MLDHRLLMVPGTKAGSAGAAIPLIRGGSRGVEPYPHRAPRQRQAYRQRAFLLEGGAAGSTLTPGYRMFPLGTKRSEHSGRCRMFLGHEHVSTAIFKAPRRSFARRTTTKEMPKDVPRQHLTHLLPHQ